VTKTDDLMVPFGFYP